MSSSTHSGYGRKCESPVSEGADYATESDLEQTTEHSQSMYTLIQYIKVVICIIIIVSSAAVFVIGLHQ